MRFTFVSAPALEKKRVFYPEMSKFEMVDWRKPASCDGDDIVPEAEPMPKTHGRILRIVDFA